MATEEFPRKELETLWAPWRVEYFEKEPRNLNFLSEAAQASDDAGHLVITRRKNAFLMVNAQARVCLIICISTSCRAGAATLISCRSSPARACSRKGCAPCMTN